jgi:hypothetical protein
MILAIENSGMQISGDSIKTKLLQEVTSSMLPSVQRGLGSSKPRRSPMSSVGSVVGKATSPRTVMLKLQHDKN